jgi:glycosyltransferase involved in cell wall biosynthesis
VPYYQDVNQLINQCDTLVVWGVEDIAKVLAGREKRVLSVHHSDLNSPWSDKLQEQDCIDTIVCVHPSVAERYQRQSRRAVYIPNGVATPVPSGVDVRSRFRFDGRKICLFPHRISWEKYPEVAVEIAEKLPDDWVLAMPSELVDRFRTEKVFCIGPIEPALMGDWLQASSCVLSLCRMEGFGYAVAEAMLAGVPVVSYQSGICDQSNATIIPDGSSPTQIADLIVGATAKPSPEFSIDRFVQQYVCLLENQGG